MQNYLSALNGQTALITGASSGIGRKTAQLLAESGCQVFVTARRLDKLLELQSQYPENIKVLAGNLNSSQFLVELDEAGFFNVDILVNNAGLAIGKSHLVDSKDEDIETVIQTNVITAFKIAKKCLTSMKAQSVGDIVNITSIASHEAYAGGVVYAASKHALLAMGKALREETYGENIRVINISPGMVETEFSEVRFNGDKEKAKAAYKGFNPLKDIDIAYQVLHALRCPRHVNIDEIIVLATDQAGATKVKRKD